MARPPPIDERQPESRWFRISVPVTSVSAASAIDPRAFRMALGQFATGVTVVTTVGADGRPQGLTVNSFCSVSLEPPLVLVCVDKRSETHEGFQASGVFGISVLAEEQQDVSERFALAGRSKFEGFPLLTGGSGAPLVPGALAHLECRLHAAHDGGDHRIYVGEVLNLAVRAGRPLLYHARLYRRLPPGDPLGS
jgi:flavin reductase (DIM6/NTAB) family NADH-FMN oxidoreductase RutF